MARQLSATVPPGTTRVVVLGPVLDGERLSSVIIRSGAYLSGNPTASICTVRAVFVDRPLWATAEVDQVGEAGNDLLSGAEVLDVGLTIQAGYSVPVWIDADQLRRWVTLSVISTTLPVNVALELDAHT